MRAISISLLIMSLLCLAQKHRVQAEENVDHHALIHRYLTGDLSAERQLLKSPDALPVLEQMLQPAKPKMQIKVEPLIRNLGHKEFAVRQHASQQLQETLPDARPKLETALRESTDTEVRWRLIKLLAFKQAPQDSEKLILRLMKSMYYKHLPEIWPEYMDLLENDPHNSRAMLLVRHTDPERVLKKLGVSPRPEQKLRYFLALKFTGNKWNRLTQQMYEFTGEEILKAADETYWPMELQPLKKDGTYHWTARCSRLEGNKAVDVLFMGIDQNVYTTINSKPVVKGPQTGRTEPPGNMVHFDTWARWDYLFRFETPYVHTYNGVALGSHHNGHLRTKVVQTIPAGVKLATARVEYPEQQNWSLGKQYDWAREFYPADLIEKIKFLDSSDSQSKILMAERHK